MHDSGMIIPAYQIPKRLGEEWDFGQYIRPIVQYYSKTAICGPALRFVDSHDLITTPTISGQLGLTPNKPPTTWQEMYEYGLKLIEAGVVKNALSFGWPDWMFENALALHDLEYANMGNGAKAVRLRSAGQMSSPMNSSPSGARWQETVSGSTWC